MASLNPTLDKWVYDYYWIHLPDDVANDDRAIEEAKAKAAMWAVPCEWSVRSKRSHGGMTHYRVRRKRLRNVP